MSHTFCYLCRIAADLYVYQEQALERCCWNRSHRCMHRGTTLHCRVFSSKGEGIWHIRFIFAAVGTFSVICLCPEEVRTRFAPGEITHVPHHRRSEGAQVIQGCITKMATMVSQTVNVLHIQWWRKKRNFTIIHKLGPSGIYSNWNSYWWIPSVPRVDQLCRKIGSLWLGREGWAEIISEPYCCVRPQARVVLLPSSCAWIVLDGKFISKNKILPELLLPRVFPNLGRTN